MVSMRTFFILLDLFFRFFLFCPFDHPAETNLLRLNECVNRSTTTTTTRFQCDCAGEESKLYIYIYIYI